MMCWAAGSELQARNIYLDTGGTSLWNKDGAAFFVHSWGGAAEADLKMTAKDGDIYEAAIPDDNTKVIFVRMPGTAAALDWSGKWNQTADLTIPDGQDMYTITGWGEADGIWSAYSQSSNGDNGKDSQSGGITDSAADFATAVPAECEDIMLQAFYWDSHVNRGFGDTKWQTLFQQANEIGEWFTLVWLPPSARPSGISSGLGYIPDDYSNQSSNLGLKAHLQFLLKALHDRNVRVLADIVINHCGNYNNKCNFFELDFGSFGKFNPDKNWITSDDEGGCGSSGHKDDGQHEANYGSARDWDHRNTQVQAMCKAYLQWMRKEMLYDGFRFDYCGGYNVSHLNDYLAAAKPYFSVMEYWYGDAATLKTRIEEAGRSTLAFDFANMYTALRDGIAKSNYLNCMNAGLRGQGYSKYAVTFVDNHDTFNRSDNNVTDFCGKGDGSSINNKSAVLQANAYILSLPGVPCVFWPHWVKYKTDIQKMITARRKAGIHSESRVEEMGGKGFYEAIVHGKHGQVILYLGASASKPAPEGFSAASVGTNYAMYYSTSGTALHNIAGNSTAPDWSRPVYSITGQQVDRSYKGVVIQDNRKYMLY